MVTQTVPTGFAAKFAGRCVRCSLPIVAGQLIVREGVKFPHLDCEASREESQAAEFELWVRTHGDAAAPAQPIVGLDLSSLPLGDTHYAVPAADGHLVFLVVQRPEAGKWLGWTFVKQFLGGQGPAQRLGSQKPGSAYHGQWEDMLKLVLADPKATAETFARELGICYICSRDLTDETSRALGIGPVCREKGGF